MDCSEQKWAKQTDKYWGLSYRAISRSYEEYVQAVQYEEYVQAGVQLYLTRTMAWETFLSRMIQAQPGRAKLTEKMRVHLERDMTEHMLKDNWVTCLA